MGGRYKKMKYGRYLAIPCIFIWLLSSRYFAKKRMYLCCCSINGLFLSKLFLCQTDLLQVFVEYRTRDHLKRDQEYLNLAPPSFNWLLKNVCNAITKSNYVIAVINSGIYCFTVRLFTGDNFMSLKCMLSFWKFIHNNLRSLCSSKVNIICYDFTPNCVLFF